MSKQTFTFLLMGLIIVIVGFIGAALYVYRDDLIKKPVPSAGARFDLYTDDEEYDPNTDSVRFDQQHLKLEREWQKIEERCRESEKRAREYRDYDYYY